MTDSHALVIGISRYAYLASVPPTRDAADVAAILADPAIGGMSAAQVELLVDAQATRAAILAGLARLARTASPSSTVVVYFSGHGATNMIVPVDAVAGQLATTALRGEELAHALAAIPCARLTVILDACRSATLLGVVAVGEPPVAVVGGRGRVVIAAATDVARVETGARNSELTAHLLAGLRGAAADPDGFVRVCDLFHYVSRKLAARPGSQQLVLRAELEDNFPLARLPTGAPAVPLCPPHANYEYDALLSYASADTTWVERAAAILERAGLRVCLSSRDFTLGRPRVTELERALERSRYTIVVYSPAYLASALRNDWQLAVAAVGVSRVIALLREPCALSLQARALVSIDATGDDHAAAFAELAARLRQPLPLPPR